MTSTKTRRDDSSRDDSSRDGLAGPPRLPYEAHLGDRSLFPDLADRAFLNHGAISPPSLAVREAVAAVVDDYAHRGTWAHMPWKERRERLRALLAALVGAQPTDIALMPNTTRGVVDVALCFPWEPGDRIVVFEGEFPTNVTPWQRAAVLFGLEVVMLPLADYADDDGPGLARLESALRKGVRLVAVSAVQFQTGLRMPIEAMTALAHRHGAEIFVDAAQACPVVPLDAAAIGVDYLTCAGHKWLMGLEGTGFLYVHPDRVAALRPHVAGWLSHEDPASFLFGGPGLLRYDRPIRARADFLESGGVNVVGLAALEASVSLLWQVFERDGRDAIWRHANAYLDRLERGFLERGFESLRAREPARRSCILGLRPPKDVALQVLFAYLRDHGVACTMPDGVLRFAPHWPNHVDEIPFVLDVVDAALRG